MSIFFYLPHFVWVEATERAIFDAWGCTYTIYLYIPKKRMGTTALLFSVAGFVIDEETQKCGTRCFLVTIWDVGEKMHHFSYYILGLHLRNLNCCLGFVGKEDKKAIVRGA